MLTILCGTTNPAKLAGLRRAAAGLPIAFVGLRDMPIPAPEVDESGRSPLDNARIKALAYAHLFAMPVCSCDTGLFLSGLPDAAQPGVHARRPGDTPLDDEGMIAHYAALAHQMGGRVTARYQNAICLVVSDRRYEHAGADIAGTAFWLCDAPHARRVPGYPLDALSLRIPDGMYYLDLPEGSGDMLAVDAGFRAFFERVLEAEGLIPSFAAQSAPPRIPPSRRP